MMKDSELNLYVHAYINHNGVCKICSKEKKEHYDSENIATNAEDSNIRMLGETQNFRVTHENIDNIILKIPDSVREGFESNDICRICFDTKLNDDNKIHYSCNHEFCQTCVFRYLENKINNGSVVSIKCLQAGCPRVYNIPEIEQVVDKRLFTKFRKFYYEKVKFMQSPNMIHCPHPDCPDIIQLDDYGYRLFVRCNNMHKSCSKCKALTWHNEETCETVCYISISIFICIFMG